MIRRFLSKNIERLVLFASGVLISGIASGLLETTINWSDAMLVGTVIAIAIGVVFLSADARICVQELSDKIDANLQNKMYSEQADMYSDLAKYIDINGAKKAILVQYSSVSATNLLRKLASKGAKITMYIQNPANAVSELQADRIRNAIQQLPGVLQLPNRYKLTIYDYDVPASIRAVKIDDTVLAFGWYTYEYNMKSSNHYPNDKIELSGHDIAGMLLFRGSKEYEVLDAMLTELLTNYNEGIRSKAKRPILEL